MRIYIPENKVQDKAGNVLDVVALKMQETKSQENKAGGFQLKTFFFLLINTSSPFSAQSVITHQRQISSIYIYRLTLTQKIQLF